MIDHRKSTRKKVASRYLLDELPPSEREEFEKHFFDCAECAEEVRALLAISLSAECVLLRIPSQNPAADAADRKRFSWFGTLPFWQMQRVFAMVPVFALLALTGIATHESFALRRQMAGQAVAVFSLRPDTRGEETAIGIQGTPPFFVLTADVPDGVHSLTWQIRSVESQAVLLEGTAPAPASGAPLTLLIPASKFKAGSYHLSLREGTLPNAVPTEIDYRFRMQ